jgi:GrpB-like predicted nucleotidyltransferase (UPF0157 family)
MNDTDLVHFLSSEEMFDDAQIIFNEKKNELETLLPVVDIQHVGSCAIPGAIGKFDIDIQIRVEAGQFEEVVDIMKLYYFPKHPEWLWNNNLAVFKNKDGIQIDYLVTVKNAREDDYYRVRDYFISHPERLKQYNELKLKYEGKPYAEYRKAKGEFLGGNGTVGFLRY